MITREYLENIAKRYSLGNATEHTFRGDLQQLIESMAAGVAATNEPKRIACGAPDYVVTRKDIPVGYIEAKDIGEDLKGPKIKEQRDRYRGALDNLVFTDYLDFHLYRGGELKLTVSIGEVNNGKVTAIPANFEQFDSLIREFAAYRGQTIRSSKTLAEMMAEKAKMLAYIIHNALLSDEASEANSTLKDQMKAFRQVLIHDLDAKAFADVYAQTIAYGMFAARLHDPSLESFSRREAAELIPRTNPFLRKLFNNIATDIDERIEWIVDALADVFRATDIGSILKNFGRSTQTHDPILHFYETFLAEYDPKLRKSRGVFYTPEPVVDFIVRAVDDILKTEFNLPMGLADTSKTTIKLKTTVRDERTTSGYKVEEKQVHKVQILDPATGTGTFLAQVIKQVHKSFEGQQGIWNNYVDEHLIPRLNGFELLMAPYAMAHLKLDLLLTELGQQNSPPYEGGVAAASADGVVLSEAGEVQPGSSFDNIAENHPPAKAVPLLRKEGSRENRFRVYLTNALEEYHPETGTLWASWLSAEANEANHIKRDTPVMVVMGNPPYAVSSSNRSIDIKGNKTWIGALLDDYKKDLNERKINLDDDYIKFIRFGQHLVNKTGEGILAYISNNSFIDGITHRQMRKTLLESFDKIYILDLHGSAMKNEKTPEGNADQNVFDIMQGVSINLFVKNGQNRNDLAEVFQTDFWGDRPQKYQQLNKGSLATVEFSQLSCEPPYYFFVPKNFETITDYRTGFSVSELLMNFNSGIQTKADEISVQFSSKDLDVVVSDFVNLPIDELKNIYKKKESSGWNFVDAKRSILNGCVKTKINYRPFDDRYIAFTNNSGGFIGRPRIRTTKHIIGKENYSLVLCRQQSTFDFQHIFVTRLISDLNSVSLQTKEQTYAFPLYTYPDSNQQTLDGKQERVPNLNMDIVGRMAEGLGMEFAAEKESTTPSAEAASTPPNQGGEFKTFAPIDILDYIYAVLHSPSYREKYKEFLKIDFPRVPYPKDRQTFWRLARLGGELREIHLLESPKVNRFITGYPVGGSNEVTKPVYKEGRVFINETQHFSGVTETAWNFYIGGYQPAQKWLKDRKGRTLNFEDIRHYQKIIVALTETGRLMYEIDKIDFL